MASPFFDPRQYLPAPINPITPSFNPSSSPIVPQQDLQFNVADILRKRQEEEEERELSAQKMLAKMIEESRNKAEEERINKLRQEMPQDVYERLYKAHYGDPQSKAGKVGSAILQIGSGLFGTAPDINKAAMDQWKTQQAAANAADTIQQREQAAAVGAISRMQQSQQRMAETESKNRTTMAGKLIESQVKEAKNAIDRMKVLGQQKGIDARAALDSTNNELLKKWGAIKAMGGLKDDGLLISVYEKEFGKEAADELVKNMTGATMMNKYQPATPGSTSQTNAPLVNAQTGEFMGMKPASTVTRSGRPPIGDPTLLMRMRGLTTNDMVNPNAPPMPQAPQIPQPQQPAGAPAAMPQGQPMAQRGAAPVPTSAAKPPSEESIFKDVGRPYYKIDPFPKIGGKSTSGLKIIGVPQGTFVGGPRPPEMTKEEKADFDAAATFASNAKSTLGLVQDAYEKGSLKENFGWGRALAEWLGMGKLVSGWKRNMGTDEAKALEQRFQQLHNFELAAYLKRISGAQVSDREYDRLRQSFADGTIDADGVMLLSLYNSVYIPTVTNMAQNGILTPTTAGQIGSAMEREMGKRRIEYMNTLRALESKKNMSGPGADQEKARLRANLERLTSSESLMDETMRKAFPDAVGSTITIPDQKRRRDVQVYIPYSDQNVEKINRDRQKAKAQEDWNRKWGYK